MRPGLGATYRIQLRPGFGFVEAAGIVGYLAELGVEVVYLSPVTEARPGSLHGYDVTDPTVLRAELGGSRGFLRLTSEIEHHGLGVMLDVVPNHLSTFVDGPWWSDLLQHGRDSEVAGVFDVDWEAGDGKVGLPLLDRPLPDLLEAGEVRVEHGDAGPRLRAGGVSLPVSGPFGPGDDPSKVLAAQHYHLGYWRDPSVRNYRRFLDIDDLAGVRVEDEDVFRRVHALVEGLAARGALSAVRVDHVDGLADPAAYLHRLTDLLDGLPVVVEKILTGDEPLPGGWPIAGTTGYEVVDDVSGALVAASGLERLRAAAGAAGEPAVDEVEHDSKALVLDGPFTAEVARVADLAGVAASEVRDAVVRLPVYRTYPADPHSDRLLYETASLPLARALVDERGSSAVRARFEQLSTGVAAKGIEDTAWYRLAGPLAFCEVGGDPGRPRADGLDRLWARAAARAADGRAGLAPGTTHDTKRSADVRARLLALTEMPEELEAGLVRLASLVAPTEVAGGAVPDRRELRFLAETMLAVLPPAAEGWEDLAERLVVAVRKSAREAKLRTSWTDPDEAYEAALSAVVTRAVADRGALVRQAFGDLVDEVARVGAVLSLAQVLLRTALPGFPDCYQGDESWYLALVDPDNRRPVDTVAAARRLAQLTEARTGDEPASLRRSWRDGRVKLLVTRQALRARKAAPAAFLPAAPVVPLPATGARAAHLVAVGRAAEDGASFVAALATRGARALPAARDDLPVGVLAWQDTLVVLPEHAPAVLVDALTGRRHETEAHSAGYPGRLVAVGDVLRDLPVALLVGAR